MESQVWPELLDYFRQKHGIEEAEGVDCYVVRTTNTINDDVFLGYYDTETFLQIKSSSDMGSATQATIFSDYREVDGLLRAFKQDIEYLPLGQSTNPLV